MIITDTKNTHQFTGNEEIKNGLVIIMISNQHKEFRIA